MAARKLESVKCTIERRRDGDMSPVFIATYDENKKMISGRYELDKEVELHPNQITSLKNRKEMVRKTIKKKDTLVEQPIYNISIN